MLQLGIQLEQSLAGLSASAVTSFFIGLMLVLFLVALVFRLLKPEQSFAVQAPNLLTSLGILGTFMGIVIGLAGFQPHDIDNSIELLLAGLKTAFLTSLVGMSLSILFKLVISLLPQKKLESIPSEFDEIKQIRQVLQGDLIQQIQLLRDQITNQQQAILDGQQIRDQHWIKMTEQIQLLHREMKEQHQERYNLQKESYQAWQNQVQQQKQDFQSFSRSLGQQLETFAEMLSKSATEQVIEALRQVIIDFNQNLTEQFGDNFKALDQSVQNLVQWQENYREQLEQMQAQYARSLESIEKTEQSLLKIEQHAAEIPKHMQFLQNVLEVNQQQVRELEGHLDTFIAIRDQAVDAIPEIQERLDEITAHIQAFTVRLDQSLQKQAEHIEQISQQISERIQTSLNHFDQIGHHLVHISSDIEKTQKSILQVMQVVEKAQIELNNNIEKSVQQIMQGTEKSVLSIEKSLEKLLLDSVRRQVGLMDEAIQKEIERNLSEMGQALTAITAQFTQDYRELVTAMAQVIQQGRPYVR